MSAGMISSDDWVSRTAAGTFAVTLSALLDLLSMGTRGPVLAMLLSDAERLLDAGDVELEIAAHDLLANGEPVEAGTSRPLHDALTGHRVGTVHFSAETSDRELLLFVALLSGDRTRDTVSFGELWQERGSWRVKVRLQVEEYAEGAAGHQDTPSPLKAPADALSQLDEVSQSGGVPSANVLRRLMPLVAAGWSTSASTPLGGALRRGGEECTMVLLDQLALAATGAERRRYFDAIVEIGGGTAHLVSALRHPRWFVARNAAELLGEMQVTEADVALANLLGHGDSWVRLAATRALARLRTDVSHVALAGATRDPEADVRAAAWRGLAAHPKVVPEGAVFAALREEEDAGVQRELLSAVKRVESNDVTIAFARFCTRLSLVDSGGYLIADAVALLSLRRPVSAMPLLRRLENHRDPAVRQRMSAIRHAVSPLCEPARRDQQQG